MNRLYFFLFARARKPWAPELWAQFEREYVTAYSKGDLRCAQRAAKRALNTALYCTLPDERFVATSLSNLASVYHARKKLKRALQLYLRALDIRVRICDPMHPHLANSFYNVAVIFDELGAAENAEPLYLRAIDILNNQDERQEANLIQCLAALADLYIQLERWNDAEIMHRRLLLSREARFGMKHLEVAFSLNRLSTIAVERGDFVQAIEICEREFAIIQSLDPPQPLEAAKVLSNLGYASLKSNKFDNARSHFQESLAIREQYLAPEHNDILLTRDRLNEIDKLIYH